MPDNQTITELKSACEALISVGEYGELITSEQHRISYDLIFAFINSLAPFEATIDGGHKIVDSRLKNRWVCMVMVKDMNMAVSDNYITQTLASDTIEIDHSLGLQHQKVIISMQQLPI